MSAALFAVDRVLQGKGTLRYNAAGTTPDTAIYPPLKHGLTKLDARFRRCKVVVGDQDILMTGVDMNDPTANGINVFYEGDNARFGHIEGPGSIFTDSLSGCVYYVFRDSTGETLLGVHASRQSGHLIDPMPAFQQAGYSLLWYYDSVGQLADARLMGGSFISCFSLITNDTVVNYALEMRNGRVMQVLKRDFIPAFHRYRAPDPVIRYTGPQKPSSLQKLKSMLKV